MIIYLIIKISPISDFHIMLNNLSTYEKTQAKRDLMDRESDFLLFAYFENMSLQFKIWHYIIALVPMITELECEIMMVSLNQNLDFM